MASVIPGVHVAMHTPRHGWTSPTTCAVFFMLGELPRRAPFGSLLWKSSIMELSQMWKFWGSQSCLGCAESPAWSRHVCDVIPGGEAFNFLSWVSGPGRLFWPEQVTQLNPCGNGTMLGRTLLSSLRCKEWPRALPVRSFFHAMSTGPLPGWPCVVTASRCRSSSNYGGHGSTVAVPGWNPGQAAEESCAPTTTTEERVLPCDVSWAPWRLRWTGSLGHVGSVGSLRSHPAQPAEEPSARNAGEEATSAPSAALPTMSSESVLSGDVEGVVQGGYRARESAGSRSSPSTSSALAQLGLVVPWRAVRDGTLLRPQVKQAPGTQSKPWKWPLWRGRGK